MATPTTLAGSKAAQTNRWVPASRTTSCAIRAACRYRSDHCEKRSDLQRDQRYRRCQNQAGFKGQTACEVQSGAVSAVYFQRRVRHAGWWHMKFECPRDSERNPRFLKEQPEIRSMPLDFTGMELASAALRHTMLRSCTIIIVLHKRKFE